MGRGTARSAVEGQLAPIAPPPACGWSPSPWLRHREELLSRRCAGPLLGLSQALDSSSLVRIAMTTFDDREKAFENIYARDQEMQFKIVARRNRLLGMWAAAKMGLTE